MAVISNLDTCAPPAVVCQIYAVFTATNSMRLPNLTDFGMPLQVAQDYFWAVYSFAPFGSVDAIAGPGLWYPAGDGSEASSSALSPLGGGGWRFRTP
jgi:hypothetical protein